MCYFCCDLFAVTIVNGSLSRLSPLPSACSPKLYLGFIHVYVCFCLFAVLCSLTRTLSLLEPSPWLIVARHSSSRVAKTTLSPARSLSLCVCVCVCVSSPPAPLPFLSLTHPHTQFVRFSSPRLLLLLLLLLLLILGVQVRFVPEDEEPKKANCFEIKCALTPRTLAPLFVPQTARAFGPVQLFDCVLTRPGFSFVLHFPLILFLLSPRAFACCCFPFLMPSGFVSPRYNSLAASDSTQRTFYCYAPRYVSAHVCGCCAFLSVFCFHRGKSLWFWKDGFV